jgi:uncharacterized protein (DUF58 family)
MALYTHRKVRSYLAGEHASVFMGRSFDFEHLREYAPGDDVQSIDWKATARSGKLLVRRFVAERKNHLILIVNTSKAMTGLAPDGRPKYQLAQFVAGVLTHVTIARGDLVSMVWLDEEGGRYLPPRASQPHAERMLRSIADATVATIDQADATGEPAQDASAASGEGTGLGEGTASAEPLAQLLDFATRAIRRQGVVVLVTDDADLPEEVPNLLRRLQARHELLVVRIADMVVWEQDAHFPVDVVTGLEIPEDVRLDARLVGAAKHVHEAADKRFNQLTNELGVVATRVRSEEAIIPALLDLLERHRDAGR